MCKALTELEEAMSNLAAGFEVGVLAPAELGPALRAAGRIEKLASALCSMLAARMASGAGGVAEGPLRRVAERQAERELAAATGTSFEDARRAIEVGRALAQQPDLDAAARNGGLSRRQAALISDAVSIDPEAAPDLVEKAGRLALGELQAECARAKAAKLDLEQRRRAVHAARSLRWYTDALGAFHLHAEGTVEEGAVVVAALKALADRAFRAARKDGRRERPEAYGWDALVALATSGGAGVPRGEVLFRVDYDAVARGYPKDGEVCEVAGLGPVSVQAVRDIIASGDPVLKAVVTKGKDVVGVAHLSRRANAHQKTALDWLYPSCANQACGARGEVLQTDHRVGWAKTHVTVLEELDRLCSFDHWRKTHLGWELVAGKGKRPFVAPDDPRHPRHVRKPKPSGAGAGPPAS
jgi:hypothetical protein